MTSARRPTSYRPRRDRREVVVAVCAVLGVILATGVLLFVLEPGDDSPSTPTVTIPSTPATVPGTTVPGSPDTPVPETGVPATAVPPVTEPPVTESTSPSGG